jgi:hypothetical protein
LSDDPDRTAVGVDARENLLLSASAYGRQRQSHDKCSSNSRYSRHDVSPVAFSASRGQAFGLRPDFSMQFFSSKSQYRPP